MYLHQFLFSLPLTMKQRSQEDRFEDGMYAIGLKDGGRGQGPRKSDSSYKLDKKQSNGFSPGDSDGTQPTP